MSVTWKRRILINDPISLDPVQIQQDLYSGNQVIVQFSDPSTYGSILDEVNELCARFDENFGVRFYSTILYPLIVRHSCRLQMLKCCC